MKFGFSWRAEVFAYFALAVLAVALQVGLAGVGALYNETDGQYAGAAREMARGGDWVVPENNGIPRLVKPPLLVWKLAASMIVFGETEFAARLPGALGVVAWVLATAALVAHFSGSARTGFLGGLVLLTSLGTATLGRIIMPEPWFSAYIAWALYCAVRVVSARDESVRGWALGFWVFAALACFTKGWHGLIYPVGIVCLSAIWVREWRGALRGLVSWPGVGIFLLICVPWFWAIESRFPGFLWNLHFTEHLGHVVGSDAPATSYSVVPRWQFLLLHVGWFFPWSVAALAALTVRRTGYAPDAGGVRGAGVFFLVWAAVVFGSAFLAGQRQDYYAMSAWPAVAAGVALGFASGWSRRSLGAVAGLGALGLLASVAMLVFAGDASEPGVAAVADRATAWTTLAGLDAIVWSDLAWIGVVAFAAACGCCFVALVRPRMVGSWAALGGVAVVFCVCGVFGYARLAPFFSLEPMRDSLAALPEDVMLVYDGGIDTGSSLLFYADRPVHVLDQDADLEFAVRSRGIGQDRFVTTQELKMIWNSDRHVALITESGGEGRWLPGRIIDRAGTQVLIVNERAAE